MRPPEPDLRVAYTGPPSEANRVELPPDLSAGSEIRTCIEVGKALKKVGEEQSLIYMLVQQTAIVC